MSGRSMQARRQVGLEFIEFLEETNRRSITVKLELRDIYNSEFRNRAPGLKDPNFSGILYALRLSRKARICDGQVHFNPMVRAFHQDQWQRPRPQPPQHGLSNGVPVQNGVSTDQGAAPEVLSGVRARRELAHRLIQNLKANRAMYISDKGGVTITTDHSMEEGRIRISVDGVTEVYVVSLFVENKGSGPVHFTYYSALHWMNCFILEDEHKVTRANPLQLLPGVRYEIQVKFKPRMVGFYPATLAFEFKTDLLPSTPAFHIVRFLEAQCVTSLARELAPTAPYRRRPITASNSQYFTVEDGEPPESTAKLHLVQVVPLKDYKVPAYVMELVRGNRPVLEGALSWENYSQKFQLLLYLEELQMEVDIKKYNMTNQPMHFHPTNKRFLVLDVPGVSENRPSVLRGDALLVTKTAEASRGSAGLVKYKGFVYRVELETIQLNFNKKLLASFIDGMQFNVEFTVSRLITRLQQRAVEMASQYKLGEVLFPSEKDSVPMPDLPDLRLYDAKLEKNPEQLRAIQNIVAGSSRPAPYLVFGPPGTGKTVTVVEAIKQLVKTNSFNHILACAPSNSAADLLCKRIVEHVDKRLVLRMYASSRNPWDVPEELLTCCNLDEDGETFVFPSKESLMEYKIMVTTLVTAGRFVTGGVPQGHYSHVFVDEAGHAVETECIIPLAGLLQPGSGQVVLAGDPKQLGPILRSPLAIKHGMGLSLLERLMKDVSLYQKGSRGTYNDRYVTKLLRNYRSHPAILKIPNELFYDGELQVFADKIVRNSYCNWEHLQKQGFPIIFHGVTGRDEREANSPSFFNVAEVEILIEYLKKLFQTQGKKGLAKISPKEIGIIAPYRKQVEKIRKAIKIVEKELKMNFKDLKVGSVEEFQGQERKVILVSTVRSSHEYVKLDQKFSLGFVKNEKRFNVATTRAKALLVVVGNPIVLREDPIWGRFIQYCEDQGTAAAFYCHAMEEEEEVLVERLAALYLQAEPQVDTEESMTQQLLDPEWRNEV
ncbi:putative helicase mov-10-B.1 [Hypomesus transpacificus]|uniref:putative helicase mov-10-B.1 n=1 Tax=Hypomesus transpacificus TaxID=137520 RepID=UPI001F080DF3|nr:putative helicase mov-10-B.1 [Hypomesus transpacificus]